MFHCVTLVGGGAIQPSGMSTLFKKYTWKKIRLALTSADLAGSDGDVASGTLPGAKPLKPPGELFAHC